MIAPHNPSASRQRGLITLAGAVMLMTVILLALNIGLISVTSQMTDTSMHADSIESLQLAESSVERAARLLAVGGAPSCTAAGLNAGTNYTLGRGSFSVLATPAPAIVSSACRFQARGTIGSVARTLQVDLLPGAATLFSEYFAGGLGPWAPVLTLGGGATAYDSNNCPSSIGVCAASGNAGTGSFRAVTNGNPGNEQLQGYRWRFLPANIVSGPAGLTITVDFAYIKHSDNGNPRWASIWVSLEDTAGVLTQIWADPTAGTAPTCITPFPPLTVPAGCWTSGAQTVTLPASRTYNRIRLYFDLYERGNNRVGAYFDAVTITDSNGTVSVIRWSEI